MQLPWVFFLRKVGVFTSEKSVSSLAARMLLEKKRLSKRNGVFFRGEIAYVAPVQGLAGQPAVQVWQIMGTIPNATSNQMEVSMNHDSPPMDNVDPVRYAFVYGTLRRGEVNDINLLQPAPRFIGTGVIKGVLYPMGWYPGLILEGSASVTGEIYAVSPTLETRLDEIEGLLPEPSGEYAKREVDVVVDGQVLPCFVYEIAPALVGHLEPIDGGDWVLRSMV
ncbi:gamma-glutamylcyclotransferase family protein [Xylophilus sp. GOD-11R]|uniref:gamma-glutamylcyclotransferase family protein n=1 Tax=Xylophilus sp. GOD-11R TaxID=3089814 RepID=UPI00298C6FCA|nr:gamma-glutamylcyclotransferase family protein [Xylophilus sp. GOD-11R]WPB54990.1 gamma-glutamylcyclotransferase family protein [Xylophilus sp. GOD-11R]